MTLKEFFTLCGLLLTLVAFVPYLRGILRNRIRPHVFSWVIWGLTTFVTFLAQLSAGAGPGAWPIGLSGVLTIAVAVLAYIKRADLRTVLFPAAVALACTLVIVLILLRRRCTPPPTA